MSAQEKTNNLKRKDLPVGQLVGHDENPNKMKDREFDLLCDNLETVGFTDPIVVRQLEEDGDKYRIVSGHHRYQAATYLGFEDVPCTIIPFGQMDDLEEDMQLLRHNTIRGKLDPELFINLHSKYASQYGDDMLQEMMGFADEAEFKKLVKQTEKQLPEELRKRFRDAAENIKTVDGLAVLLNKMFTRYGDTLQHGYMIFDYGGRQSYWLRVGKKTYDALDIIAELCVENGKTVDDIIGGALQVLASGEQQELIARLIDKAPDVDLPEGMQVVPTRENIEKQAGLANGG